MSSASKQNLRDYDVVVRPILTEKSNMKTEDAQYFFHVSLDSTKPEIKAAVERLFKVKVKSVNTLVRKGKTKRFRGRIGIQKDMKKAMVCLEKGQRIDLSSGV
jgi:large subunit ribosomal protein L23